MVNSFSALYPMRHYGKDEYHLNHEEDILDCFDEADFVAFVINVAFIWIVSRIRYAINVF